MARREQHRAAVIEVGEVERAHIVVPVESIEWPGRPDLRLKAFRRWMHRVDDFPATELQLAGSTASVVVDRVAFTIYFGDAHDGCEVTGTHDGDAFTATATETGSVDVYLTADVDVRRTRPEGFRTAAADGRVVGARITTYEVAHL